MMIIRCTISSLFARTDIPSSWYSATTKDSNLNALFLRDWTCLILNMFEHKIYSLNLWHWSTLVGSQNPSDSLECNSIIFLWQLEQLFAYKLLQLGVPLSLLRSICFRRSSISSFTCMLFLYLRSASSGPTVNITSNLQVSDVKVCSCVLSKLLFISLPSEGVENGQDFATYGGKLQKIPQVEHQMSQ